LILANVLAFFFVEPGFGTNAEASKYFFENAPLPCQAAEAFNIDTGESCPVGRFTLPVSQTESVPVDIPDRDTLSLLSAILLSTFLHGGFLHIAGNMLFLWVFGNNIEDFLGPVKYVLFYLIGGIVAAFAHIFTHLDDIIPAVGASGAVAAVMGAYLVLYPRARVNVLVPIFILWTVIQLSAIVVLGLWFVYQFLIGAPDIAGGQGGGVAWMAHVGGFVFGVLGILLLGGRPHRADYYSPWRTPRY
jgi:hypothetical protein